MASSGWEDMTEAAARRLGRRDETKQLRTDLEHIATAEIKKLMLQTPRPPKGHKYRAIPCIVTADLTLFVEADIAALEAKPRSTIGVGNPKLPLRERANSVGIIGDWFGSTKEAKFWIELKRREVAGEITDLRRQVPFDLYCPTGPEESEVVARYVLDFAYKDADGTNHYIDTKGQRTAMFRMKSKWLKLQSGFTIEEV